jgi:hypothetical protein
MLTKERAHKAWEARGAEQTVEHTLTKDECAYVKLIWDHMPGNSTWMDAFFLIMNAKREGPPEFQPLDFVIVKNTHGYEAYRGRRGMIRSYVPFGKLYVYLRPAGQTYGADVALCIIDESDLARDTPSHQDVVCLTGATRENGCWGTSDEIKPGDIADESLYWEWLEAVPPATHKLDLMQMGEPMDHNGLGDKPRFLTMQKHGEQWIYTGIRVRGERVQIKQ